MHMMQQGNAGIRSVAQAGAATATLDALSRFSHSSTVTGSGLALLAFVVVVQPNTIHSYAQTGCLL